MTRSAAYLHALEKDTIPSVSIIDSKEGDRSRVDLEMDLEMDLKMDLKMGRRWRVR